MANEHLKRRPTHRGNIRKWTLSFWMKNSDIAQGYTAIFGAGDDDGSPTNVYNEIYFSGSQIGINLDKASDPDNYALSTEPVLRDPHAWTHVCVLFTDQGDNANTRIRFYFNGSLVQNGTSTNLQTTEFSFFNDPDYVFYIGSRVQQDAGTNTFKGEFFDFYLVDGATLEPETFGYFKNKVGYQSNGNAESIDQSAGIWRPRLPKSVKETINRKGGFGQNGFYVPLNDASNFGADFHCTPNSIVKLKGETDPQPRNGAPDTTDSYVSELRDDPYAADLVLAIPGISGGQSGGYGDYSADIKGSGSNKTVTRSGDAQVAISQSYYGSALDFADNTSKLEIANNTDFQIGDGNDFTIELWVKRDRDNVNEVLIGNFENSSPRRAFIFELRPNNLVRFEWTTNGSSGTSLDTPTNSVPLGQWTHLAAVRYGDVITVYVNGVPTAVSHGVGTIYTNTVDPLRIGIMNANGDQQFNGQIQDVRFYRTAKYKGGFDIVKPFTPVGIETGRLRPDTCINNFATLNPIYEWNSGATNSVTFSEGNLFAQSAINDKVAQANMAFRTGKWYWETRIYNDEMVGIGVAGGSLGNYPGNNYNGLSYHKGGSVYTEATAAAYGAGWSSSEYHIIGCAADMDNNIMYWHVDGTWANSANPSAGTGGNPIGAGSNISLARSLITPSWRVRSASATEQVHVNFGQNPTFGSLVAVNRNRANASSSNWHQSSNGGNHVDWTVSADGTNLQVSVPAGNYARAWLLASEGTLDPKKKYLISFDYVSGPANLGVASANSGASIDYLTAVDGSVSPNGLSAGNRYSFEFQGDSFAFTGFQIATYEINDIIVSEITEGYTDTSGKGKFAFEVPTGFKALCDDNLSDESGIDPGDHFKINLWQGNGGFKNIYTGFEPGLVWIKPRDLTDNHVVFDVARGVGRTLYVNDNGTEAAPTVARSVHFGETGYNVTTWNNLNNPGNKYVGWAWKAGGPPVANNDGSIQTQISVNQTAGFSCGTYTGDVANTHTIGHGLGKIPHVVIVKERNANSGWAFYHHSMGNTKVMYLNVTDDAYTETGDTASWNATDPTDTVFHVGKNGATNDNTLVFYAWSEIPGYSKFGSYQGRSNDNGTFVYCGFKPAWVMIKATNLDPSAWIIVDSARDPHNPCTQKLCADHNGQENTSNPAGITSNDNHVDLLSNGFKLRKNNTWTNNSAYNYVFMAFAESPFSSAPAK